jgi:antitoxin YefM
MKMVPASERELHQNLDRYLDQAINGGTPILVTCDGGKGNVVILSETDFSGWRETVHLLSNPTNARRLLQSIRETEAGARSD